MVAAVAAGALVAASQTLDTHAAEASDASEAFLTPRLASDDTTAPDLAEAWFAPEVLPEAAAAGTQDVAALGKAAKLAVALAQEQSRPRPGEPYVAGNNHSLDGWIAQALGLLGLPQGLAGGVKRIIMHESNGDPNAVNLSDSNARAGHPSRGLMQLVPATFQSYALPSLANRPITDPVANIAAGLRYMIANYGLSTVAAGGRTDRYGNYLGY